MINGGEGRGEEALIHNLDGAACIMMTARSWKAVEAERGYVDIRPEHAWEEWQQVRKYLGQTD